MVKRKIIKIDESLCDGCARCTAACAESAIRIVDGKARVVSDAFCDGLGACIDECPKGALTIEEREANEFDEQAAKSHSKLEEAADLSAETKSYKKAWRSLCNAPLSSAAETSSDRGPEGHMRKLDQSLQLSNWPIQMELANASASYFKNSRLLISADCSAFSAPSISDFIKGRVVLIGCPKLDETKPFVDRLAEILRKNEIRDITILHMEVPCCSKLVRRVMEAMKISEKRIPLSQYICMIGGRMVKEENGRQ